MKKDNICNGVTLGHVGEKNPNNILCVKVIFTIKKRNDQTCTLLIERKDDSPDDPQGRLNKMMLTSPQIRKAKNQQA